MDTGRKQEANKITQLGSVSKWAITAKYSSINRTFTARTKETKKPVKQVAHHNRITYTLFYFEYEWRQRWIVEVEKAKAGLLATLIIRHPNNNKLYVNFDAEILTLIREAKCLSRIGIEIPESAKIVLL